MTARPPQAAPHRSFGVRPWTRLAWAAPWSLVGLAIGCLACLLGAQVQRRSGTLEFSGGRLGRAVALLPPRFGFVAITFGHVILGVDAATLDAARTHEQVHVRQYERWGPLFVPAYLAESLAQWLRGGRAYLDNRFEREARGETGGSNGR